MKSRDKRGLPGAIRACFFLGNVVICEAVTTRNGFGRELPTLGGRMTPLALNYGSIDAY
jgi:hypothetical protein